MDSGSPIPNWITQLRKGFLDLCILNCLNTQEYYGYDLVQRLKAFDGTAMREGIIYPILARMQEDGLVTSERRPSTAGPPRKYYQITAEGRRALADLNAYWKQMTAVMDTISTPEEERHE